MEKQLTIFDVNHPLNRRLQLAKEGGLYFETPRLVMIPMCKEDAPRVFQWTSDGVPKNNLFNLIFNLHFTILQYRSFGF